MCGVKEYICSGCLPLGKLQWSVVASICLANALQTVREKHHAQPVSGHALGMVLAAAKRASARPAHQHIGGWGGRQRLRRCQGVESRGRREKWAWGEAPLS